ncbi:PLD nuclease N-terminal domain-containing protein [Rhodococcus sp. NPDC078407]|uniref:PLD nuclease N-terminal domain-containing protein n=1 Tax=Rhodococcus sp. NPDC078407 TaxID=3364509 RepID=UPI0037CB444F
MTVLLSLLALLSIVRDRTLGLAGKLAWAFVVVILPIVGPILWFTVGKRYPYGPSGGNR